ncbi:MAG: hypothetical protein JWN14_4262, partial [Chthonomonadales bacterium]|nr:hypothetical protein [Chthonomonadales bacterium]
MLVCYLGSTERPVRSQPISERVRKTIPLWWVLALFRLLVVLRLLPCRFLSNGRETVDACTIFT